MNSNVILMSPDGYVLGAAGGGGGVGALNLQSATPFQILAASTVTNTGPTTITGNLGLYAGTSVTGFPPGTVVGVKHVTDQVANQAEQDANTAWVAGLNIPAGTPIVADLGGQTLSPGVYTAASTIGITGTLTLDGGGNPNASWIFQAGSALTTASASSVALINGAKASNVFWLLGSAATLGTTSNFAGTIIAYAAVTDDGYSTVNGRLFSLTAAVNLNNTDGYLPGSGSAGGTAFRSNWMDKRSAMSVSLTLTLTGTNAPDGYASIEASDCPEQFGGSLGMPQYYSKPIDVFTVPGTSQYVTTNSAYHWDITTAARWVRVAWNPIVDVSGLAVHVYANAPYSSPG